jgi:hypothetical protein
MLTPFRARSIGIGIYAYYRRAQAGVLAFEVVIPGRGRIFAHTNLSHSNWSGGESRRVWLYGDSHVEIPGSPRRLRRRSAPE